MTKTIKKILSGTLAILSLYVFGSVLVRALYYSPVDEVPLASLPQAILQVAKASSEPTSSYPLRLKIPAISVNAKVKYVGITKAGNMATPGNFVDVGWYKYGAVPGEKGSAVIAGHVDNGLALPGVFKHLVDVRKGDDVYVENAAGKTVHFVVTGIDTYSYDSKVDKIFNQDDSTILRLITCTGTFVKAYGTHDKRLVVTAKMVKEV